MTPARLGARPLVARGPAVWLPWVLVAHVVVLAGIGLVRGRSLGHVVIDVAAVGVFTGLSFWGGLTERARSVAVAIGLMVAAAVFVHLTGGAVESHFYFFVLLGLLALYDDWLPFAAAASAVLVEHGVVGMLAPDAVFGEQRSDADALQLAAVHGVYVLAGERRLPHRLAPAPDHAPGGGTAAPRDGRADAGRLRRCADRHGRRRARRHDPPDQRRAVHAAGCLRGRAASVSTSPRWPAPRRSRSCGRWSSRGRPTVASKLDLRAQYHRPDGSVLWTQVTMALVCDDARPAPSHARPGRRHHRRGRRRGPARPLGDARPAHRRRQPLGPRGTPRADDRGGEPARRGARVPVHRPRRLQVGERRPRARRRRRAALRGRRTASGRACGRRTSSPASVGTSSWSSPRWPTAPPWTSSHHGWWPWSGSRSRWTTGALRVRCSIGVALHVDTDPTRANALVKAADLAMYRAKAAGRGAWIRYRRGDESMPEPVASRRTDVEDRYRQLLDDHRRAARRPRRRRDRGGLHRVRRRSSVLPREADLVGREIEDFLTPEAAVVSAKRRAIQVAGGWPEPDTMRIVTFPGDARGRRGVVAPRRLGGHGWRTRCTCARSTRRWPRSPGSAWSSPVPAPKRSSWSTSTAASSAWNSHATELFGWTAEEAIGRTTERGVRAARRTRPRWTRSPGASRQAGELDGRADRADEARPGHRRAPDGPVRARLAGQPPGRRHHGPRRVHRADRRQRADASTSPPRSTTTSWSSTTSRWCGPRTASW